jgi:hypothetical protein
MVAVKHPLKWDQRNSHVGLLGKLDFSKLGSVGHHVLVLNTHNTTAPVSSEGLVLVELSAEVLAQDLEVLEVLLANISKSDAGGSLLMDELAKTCLALNEGEGDALLSAEGGEEGHHLKGINVVSNHNELSLAFLNEVGNVVKTELDDNRLGTLLGISTILLALSAALKSGLLLLVGLGLVFSEQFKKLACYTNINYKYC